MNLQQGARRFPPTRLIVTVASLFSMLLVSGVGWAQGSVPQDLARKLRLLEEILARPEFQWREDAPPTLLQRFWQWLARQLFNQIPRALDSGDLLANVLMVLGIIGLLAALLYAFIRLRRQFVRSEATEHEARVWHMRDPDEAMRTAETMAQHGDYRLALRYLYHSSLLLLDERNLIDYDRTRTNREYLLSVRDKPPLEALLSKIVNVFDRSWYGLQTPDAQTYEQFVSYVQTLRELR